MSSLLRMLIFVACYKKFRSFCTVVGLIWPVVRRPVLLPLRSKVYLSLFASEIYSVFSINMTWTFPMPCGYSVKTPKILTSSEFGFSFRWLRYASCIRRKVLSSELVIVLMINRLSCEKKKNEPDFPVPSPD